MATKDSFLPLNVKQKNVITDSSNGQYNNLNLNLNHQNSSSDAFHGCSKSATIGKKKDLDYDFLNNDDSQTKKDSNSSWNKSTKNSSSLLNNGYDFGKEDERRKGKKSTTEGSTLSLHISAFENAIDVAAASASCDNVRNGKKWIQQFIHLNLYNQFEFPRQQNGEMPEPEMSQFKASHRLLNPNENVLSLTDKRVKADILLLESLNMQVAIYGFQNRVKRVENAGIAYELNIILDRLALGLPTEPILKNYRRPGKDSPTLEDLEAEEDEALFDHDCDGYRKYLSSLCPKTWREQDHYKVLGLSKLRYRATPGQIKTAYRQKVLRYHPDKGKYKEQLGQQGNDAFSCIQKAYELMCEEDKRRAYDSIDPDFDEEIPDASQINAKNFFTKLGPVFERNARFSKVEPAPLLGDEKTSRSDVEHFYDFWFSFPSWREFSYLDAEDKSKGEDRYERREIEKQNKIEREKLRKQDSKRISNLIHLAYDKDPRIVIFKKEDKQKKENEKERKRLEKQKREDERKAVEMEEERKKAEEEEKVKEEKKKADNAKKAEKKVTAAKRKKLRDIAAAADYWTKHSGSKLAVMEHIERICIGGSNEQLDEMAEKLSGLADYDEVVALLTNTAKKDASLKAAKKEQTEVIGGKENGWTDEQISLLIKAANVFPAGTSRRWAQVTSYINDHHRDGVPKTEKEVIKQAKAQAAQVTAPTDASKTQGQKETAIDSVGAPVASSNSTTTAAAPTSNGSGIPLDDWSTDEQMNFENALKTIPGSDPKRWEKIAEATGKTKKECIQRYKKIVEMLKARKA